MKKIAVIGAGGTGVALSAILASKGHEVYLTDNLNQTVVEAAQEAGVLRTKGTKVCEGRPALVTSNIEEAVRCAELIVCCTISNRDEEIARTLAPVVTKEQAVLVGAGNGATIVYHKIFEEAGKGDVLTAETAGNFFPARVTGAGESTIGLPLAPKGVTSFPPQRAAEAAERFAEVWELNPYGSMMDALFNGPNLICHSAGCILNASAISRSGGKFCLFTDGLSEGFLNVTDALWEEKARVYEAMGCKPSPAPRGMLAGVMDVQNEDYRYFRLMDGPGSLEHRYITEDVPYLTCFFVSVAHAAGVKVPLFEGVVGLLSAAAGRDFTAEGRTLENLGWGCLSREELIRRFKA